MTHRARFSTVIPVFAALGLVLTIMLSAPLAHSVSADKGGVANGGNSANAKLCQNGGWQGLMDSNGVQFTSEEACTSSGAQGLGVVPIPPPTGSIIFFNDDFGATCDIRFSLRDFPDTVTLVAHVVITAGDGIVLATGDFPGLSNGSNFDTLMQATRDQFVTVTVGGTTVGPTPVTC